MGTIRISDIRFFGGPYDKLVASMTLIPDLVFIHDGDKMMIHAYAKVEEMTYVYSILSTVTFPRTPDGRANFLDMLLKLPDYGIIWKNSDEIT